jgi:phosphoenolpyruvate carboxykinase (ATP)
VREPATEKDVWWAGPGSGSPNYEMDERAFLLNRETAFGHLNGLARVFVFDGYANWSPESRIKIR